MSKQETGNRKQETGNRKQETGNNFGLLNIVKQKLKPILRRHPLLDTGSGYTISYINYNNIHNYKKLVARLNCISSLISLLKYAQSKKTNSKSKIIKAGFTLVELAIVLVIIGLLTGGVLVGQDLIKASEIRAQVSQITKYNSAVRTFQTKYNGLPGDLLYTEARAFGLYAPNNSVAGGPGYEDGNASLANSNGTGNVPFFIGEPVIFWRHLSEANLIDGAYSITTGAAAGNIDVQARVAVQPTSVDMINKHIPPAKIGSGASITVGAYNGLAGAPGASNYYALAGINMMEASRTAFDNSTNPLTAQEAYNIDSKMDDGLPLTGIVTATNSVGASLWRPLPGYPSPPLAACVSSSAYVLSGTTQSCSLQFKFQ